MGQEILPGIRQSLDTIASNLLGSFNAIHSTGTSHLALEVHLSKRFFYKLRPI